MEHNETPSEHLARLGGHDTLVFFGVPQAWAYRLWDAARLHARDGAERWERQYWQTVEQMLDMLRPLLTDDD